MSLIDVNSYGGARGPWVDEEECLPFPIFIAELELLVGNSKNGRPDGVQLLELLQKLVATIPRTDKAVLKLHQRQCESMLYDVLTHGIGAAVRRLIYSCVTLLYAHGDSIPIYTRMNTLMTYLSSKEGLSRSTAEAVRVGLLDFVAHLNSTYGRMLANSAQESVSLATRTVAKSGNQLAVRCAALRMAAAAVAALNPLDRSAPAVQAEAWSLVQRFARERAHEEIRHGCLELLGGLCTAGAGALWREGAFGAEEAVRLCLALVDDPAQAVREAACRVLGALAAASRSAAAADAVAAEKRPAKKAAAERTLAGYVKACLAAPMIDAAVLGRREVCLALSGSWMSYIHALPLHRHGHDSLADLMDVAMLLISTVSEAGRVAAEARSVPPAPGTVASDGAAGELGLGLAGGELPPLQASALLVLRRGVLQGLAEAGQRKLLERLANLLDKRLVTPAAVVTLEALATLLQTVGEVPDEIGTSLERLLQPHVVATSTAVRQQAAVTLAALAAAHPAAAARMLSGCLDAVSACTAQLCAQGPSPMGSSVSGAGMSPVASSAGIAAHSNGAGGLATPPRVSSFTPGGLGRSHGVTATPDVSVRAAAAAAAAASCPSPVASGSNGATSNGASAQCGSAPSTNTASSGFLAVRPGLPQRALLDTCHGAALAAARLLLAAARAPLGCPARLQLRALALAEELITGPGPEHASSRAVCREVGFLLLGPLCCLGVAQAGRSVDDMLGLWAGALGEAARTELDERSYARPGGDVELAVQLWWRSVALQALAVYVTSVLNGAYLSSTSSSSSLSSTTPAATPAATPRGGQHRPGASLAAILSAAGSFSMGSGLSAIPERLMSGGGAGSGMGARTASAPAGLNGSHGGEGTDAAGEVLQRLGPLVQPLLDLLETQTYLQDPARARGGAGGVLAGASATFTLSLLELHLRVPGGRVVTASPYGAALLKICLRPFRTGLSHASADALTRCALRGLLCADDAPLGPWPPSADPNEAALRVYTGERGAPHPPPWASADELPYLGAATPAAFGSAIGSSPAAGDPSAGLAAAPPADDAAVGGAATTASGVAVGGSVGGQEGSPASGVDLASGAAAGAPAALSHASYPQPVGLGPALLSAELVLLGRIMAAGGVAEQLQLLEAINAAVAAAKAQARQARDAASLRRLPLAVAAATAALAAFGTSAMAARGKTRSPLDPTDRVPDKLLQLAQAVIPDEHPTSPEAAALSRAAAELFAASAATGSDAWVLRVVRALAAEVQASASEGRDPERRAVVALALGAAHRARGGLAMQGAVAGSVEALVAAGSRPGSAAAAAWALHGLWLVACSSGGAFVPRVKTSLQLAQELLVSSFESPALCAACARLANAAVAVLGPEFTLGSLAYQRAKSLVLASGDAAGGAAGGAGAGAEAANGGGDHTGQHGREGAAAGAGGDGGLGLVLFVQQVVLFAPGAVPPAKHVPLLLAHLLSRQPDLRAASALTLRHLGERSAAALSPAAAAPLLFAALDAETDERIAGHLRSTITTVLSASASREPSFWLALLSDVIFAAGAPPSTAAVGGPAAAGAADGGHREEEDDEQQYGGVAASGAAGGAGGKGNAAAATRAARSLRTVLSAPHLRTRHFAATCLLRLVRVCVAADERHRDASVLERQRGTAGEGDLPDPLIAKLQALVDVGFKLATIPLESLRPYGVRLLALLVTLFGDVPDPLLHGARLMEQYQAQVVSALRSSLGARHPTAAAAAGAVGGVPPSASAANLVPLGAGPGAAGAGAGVPALGISATAAATAAQHPLLQIAGGLLATTFLESGLAAGDALVLRRLMELLSAPLSAWHNLSYDAYAEWVGARARVELLRAHAQVSTIAASAAARGDSLCAGIVAKAHEPHAAMLQALWAQLLTDHAILCSQPQGSCVLAAYRSPLLECGVGRLGPSEPREGQTADTNMAGNARSPFSSSEGELSNGDGGLITQGLANGKGGRRAGVSSSGAGESLTPVLAPLLRPVYASACPAALAALAGSLPAAAALAADAAAAARYQRLLDIALMLLTDAAARLAHAVQHAVQLSYGDRGRSTGGPGDVDTQEQQGAVAHLRTAAGRMVGVLQALQRLVSSDCLQQQQQQQYDGGAGAPVAGLVPVPVLRDLLQALSAAAAHALLPLHWALARGRVPAALVSLLPALALPCCTLVREVCTSVPDTCLACAAPEAGTSPAALRLDLIGGSSGGSAASPNGGSPMSRSWSAGDSGLPGDSGHDAEQPGGGDEPACKSSTGYGSAAGPGPGLVAPAAEVVLVLASACVPYTARGDQEATSGALPGFVAGLGEGAGPGCAPGLELPGDADGVALAPCVVQLLAAAQLLMRRAPWSSLEPHVGPLLELPLRLMLSAPPASPIVTAAQRYSDGVLAVLAARAASAASNGAGAEGQQGGGSEAAAESCAAAAVVALADAAGGLLQSVTGSSYDGEAVAGWNGFGRQQQPQALARLTVVAGATVLGAAALPAEDRDGASAAAACAVSPADARECAMGLLVSALGEQVSPAASLAVLEVVRAAVQEAAGEELGSARGVWARLVVGSLAPAAVARAAALLSGARQPLAGPEQSLVSECLKLLVLATTLSVPHGPAAQAGVMQVLVPLLVEAAAPSPPAVPTPALRDMAVKLITSLPAAACGAAFKTQLAAQPAAAKLRLQGALREVATAAASVGAGAAAAPGTVGAVQGQQGAWGVGAAAPGAAGVGGVARKPAIQLKTTFVLPVPK